MKERPILFSAPMVRAILEGRKTQTRRIISPQPDHLQVHTYRGKTLYDVGGGRPHGGTWTPRCSATSRSGAPTPPISSFAAEGFGCARPSRRTPRPRGGSIERTNFRRDRQGHRFAGHVDGGWRPSIFMPRKASRLTLEVLGVRVERLQEISRADAAAEGCVPLQMDCGDATLVFEGLLGLDQRQACALGVQSMGLGDRVSEAPVTRRLTATTHNLTAEVFAVLPVCEPAEVSDLAFRVYDRFRYAADEEDVLPSELEGGVADRLRQLRAKGRAEKVGDGWKRSGAPGSART